MALWFSKKLIFKIVYRKKFLIYCHKKNFPFTGSVVLHAKKFSKYCNKNYDLKNEKTISPRDAYLRIYSFSNTPPGWLRSFVAIVQSISSAFWPIHLSMLGTNCTSMVPKLSALTSMMFELFIAVSHVCSRRFVRFAQYFEIWEYQFACKNCSKSSNFQTFYKSI